MQLLQNILYPTDFSLNANNALPFVIDLVRKTNAKFSLLNVYELPWNAHEKGEIPITTFREQTRTSAMEALKEIVGKNQLDNHPHRCYVREGNAQAHIVELIAQENIDLVVMGTKGASAKQGIFMGSTTKAVFQNSTCPVLAIPDAAAFRKPAKIVYATDLQYDETLLVDYVVKFAGLYNAEIFVLHVTHDKGNRAWNKEALEQIINSSGYPKITYKDMVEQDTEEGIEKFIKELDADMLAMTTYSTTLFDKLFRKSLTGQLMLHTSVPLLAFNRKKYNTTLI